MGIATRGKVALVRLCLALATLLAAPAIAKPLPRPCLLATEAHEDGAALIEQPARFDCAAEPGAFSGPATWGLFTGVSIHGGGRDPLLIRHSPHRFDQEDIWVRYADGRVRQIAGGHDPQRQRFSSGIMSFELPPGPTPVTSILMRFTGLQNQRGLAPNAAVLPRSVASQQDQQVLLSYAICAGVLATLLIYNLLLFAVLRFRFILAYCATAVAALATTFVWSGGIFSIAPALSPNMQVSLLLLGFSAYTATVVWFMFSFIGRSSIAPAAAFALKGFVAVILAAGLLRVIDDTLAWRLVDQVWYGAMTGWLIAMLGGAALAAARGSRPARFYMAVWTLPILFALARIAWGVRLAPQTSVLAEISALFLMTAECLLTAFAVGWQVRVVKTESDESRGRENALRALAEVDPLSGLLNRRAFLERACEGNQVKGLALFDIDHFKSINDRFGHDVGDQVITAFAALLGRLSPPHALVGRMGGEEFAVLLQDGAPDAFAHRVLQEVAALAWTPDGTRLTVSAGAAFELVRNEPEWRRLYIAADAALLDAKRQGRNRVVRATTALAA